MKKITLNRTGDRPIRFTGELVKKTSSQTNSGAGESRYWELALYCTSTSKWVIAIGYRTRWQGEHDTDTVYVCEDVEEMVDILQNHYWQDGIRGYPPGHEARQERLFAALQGNWEAAVTEILSVVEAEEI